MANSLGINLTGKTVIFHQQYLLDHLVNTQEPFLVEGGFGAVPYTSGTSLVGTFLSDGEHGAMRGHFVERLATDEEIAAAKARFADRPAAHPRYVVVELDRDVTQRDFESLDISGAAIVDSYAAYLDPTTRTIKRTDPVTP